MNKKLNILYIFTDEQAHFALSCAGNANVQTPAADSLAARGLRFTHAYCAQPVCFPSRMAMQTGRWPHANGVTVNHGSHDMTIGASSMAGARPMLGKMFADAGFETGYFGRWHITLPIDNANMHGYQTVVQHQANDPEIAPAFEEFLDKPREKPFFSVVSICNPHDICEWPSGSKLANGPIAEAPPPEECPPLPDNFEIPENEPSILREFQQHRAPDYVAPGFTPDQWRQYRWAYWRFVERADFILSEILDALKERELLDETIIVFASDHGEGAASHRWCQKQALYEESTRVPFIISSPGSCRAGETEDTLMNAGIDLYPTLCDLAGIPLPHWLHGESLKPFLDGNTAGNCSDYVVTETEFHGKKPIGARGRMLRTRRYKYNAFSRGEPREQLFDLVKDSGEMDNLAGNPEYSDILSEHRKKLYDWCQRFDDYFIVPGHED